MPASQDINLHVNDVGMELRSHGTVQFPCASYLADVTSSPENQVPWHWHEELEIIYAVSGSLIVQIPSQTVELQPGQLFFINSNVAHTVRSESAGLLRSAVFRPSLLAGDATSIFAQRYITPLTQAGQIPAMLLDGGAVAEDFAVAFDALEAETFGYEFLVREKLATVVLEVIARNEELLQAPQQSADVDSVRLDKMLRFIHAHFDEPLQLSEIAAAAAIGERECLRCFKKTIGESPIQYLLRFRAEQARAFLSNRPEVPVADVAVRHGFESPSYFAQVFKRYYGVTPKQYRTKTQER